MNSKKRFGLRAAVILQSCLVIWLFLLTGCEDFFHPPLPPATYTVDVDGTIQNGSITATPGNGTVGTRIILTVAGDGGFTLVPGSLEYTDGFTATPIPDPTAGNTTSFILPAGDVTVTASFGIPIPINGKTYTVIKTPPAGAWTADRIYLDTASTPAAIQIGNSSGGHTDYTGSDTNYDLLYALLNSTGMETNDAFTFDNSGKISAIKKADTATNHLSISVGTTTGGVTIASSVFADPLTLTGNATRNIDISGASLRNNTTVIFDATGANKTYSFYGVRIDTIAGNQAMAAVTASGEFELDAGHTGSTVTVTTASTAARLKIIGTPTAITNAKAGTAIAVTVRTAVTASAAATVDIGGLSLGDTVHLEAGSSAVTVSGVKVTPNGAAGTPVIITAGSGPTEFSIAAIATTEISVGGTTVDTLSLTGTAPTNPIAVTTPGHTINVGTLGGVQIAASAAAKVDVTGLTAGTDTVKLKAGTAPVTVSGIEVTPTGDDVTITVGGTALPTPLSIAAAAGTRVSVGANDVTVTFLEITGTTTPTNPITVLRGGVTFIGGITTGVKLNTTGLTTDTVIVDKSGSGGPVIVDGVSITPDTAGTPATVTKTAGTKFTLAAGTVNDLVDIQNGAAATEITFTGANILTSNITTANTNTIINVGSMNGLKIVATEDTKVDVSGLASTNTVSLGSTGKKFTVDSLEVIPAGSTFPAIVTKNATAGDFSVTPGAAGDKIAVLAAGSLTTLSILGITTNPITVAKPGVKFMGVANVKLSTTGLTTGTVIVDIAATPPAPGPVIVDGVSITPATAGVPVTVAKTTSTKFTLAAGTPTDTIAIQNPAAATEITFIGAVPLTSNITTANTSTIINVGSQGGLKIDTTANTNATANTKVDISGLAPGDTVELTGSGSQKFTLMAKKHIASYTHSVPASGLGTVTGGGATDNGLSSPKIYTYIDTDATFSDGLRESFVLKPTASVTVTLTN